MSARLPNSCGLQLSPLYDWRINTMKSPESQKGGLSNEALNAMLTLTMQDKNNKVTAICSALWGYRPKESAVFRLRCPMVLYIDRLMILGDILYLSLEQLLLLERLSLLRKFGRTPADKIIRHYESSASRHQLQTLALGPLVLRVHI